MKNNTSNDVSAVMNAIEGMKTEYLSPILASMNELTARIERNEKSITQCQNEIKEIRKAMPSLEEISSQIKAQNKIFITGAKNVDDAKSVINEIIGKEATFIWISNERYGQKLEDKINVPRVIAELPQYEKQFSFQEKVNSSKMQNKTRQTT